MWITGLTVALMVHLALHTHTCGLLMVWPDSAEDKGQGVNHHAPSLDREVQTDWNVPVVWVWPAEVSWCGRLRSDKSEGPHQEGVFAFHLCWMKAWRLPGLRLESVASHIRDVRFCSSDPHYLSCWLRRMKKQILTLLFDFYHPILSCNPSIDMLF